MRGFARKTLSMKKLRNVLFLFLFLSLSVYVLVSFYPYIFSRKVEGVIMAVERVTPPMAILTNPGQAASAQIFSFAVGVRDEKTGEIVTGSTEDRQWAVAKPGQCAEAEFFPYPPWEFPKWGTYYNVRLLMLRDCNGVPPAQPAPNSEPPPPASENQLFGG